MVLGPFYVRVRFFAFSQPFERACRFRIMHVNAACRRFTVVFLPWVRLSSKIIEFSNFDMH